MSSGIRNSDSRSNPLKIYRDRIDPRLVLALRALNTKKLLGFQKAWLLTQIEFQNATGLVIRFFGSYAKSLDAFPANLIAIFRYAL